MLELNTVHCMDCLDFMKSMPDKCVDLCLTDPPYGIQDWNDRGTNKNYFAGREKNKLKVWDKKPDKIYFEEIFRISKNQIIWGANHFIKYLENTKAMIIWDKNNIGMHFNNFELAWTSNIKEANRSYKLNTAEITDIKFHPTQKPVCLFQWILQNYSQSGMTIFDPFAGSGTTAIACLETGRNYILVEKEPDYIEIINKRIAEWKEQGRLFKSC